MIWDLFLFSGLINPVPWRSFRKIGRGSWNRECANVSGNAICTVTVDISCWGEKSNTAARFIKGIHDPGFGCRLWGKVLRKSGMQSDKQLGIRGTTTRFITVLPQNSPFQFLTNCHPFSVWLSRTGVCSAIFSISLARTDSTISSRLMIASRSSPWNSKASGEDFQSCLLVSAPRVSKIMLPKKMMARRTRAAG
jgi:hypothetical protein